MERLAYNEGKKEPNDGPLYRDVLNGYSNCNHLSGCHEVVLSGIMKVVHLSGGMYECLQKVLWMGT